MTAIWQRAATAEDCPAIAGWLNDPATNALLSSNLRQGGITAQALTLGLRRRDQLWTVFGSGADQTPQGLIALDSIDAQDRIANLWFVLGDVAARGQGLTHKAIAAFCIANPAQLHVATAWIVDGNTASVRCLEKAGFRHVGRIKQGVRMDDGSWRDRILMQGFMGQL